MLIKGGIYSFKQIDDLQTKIGRKYKENIHITCKEFYWHQLGKKNLRNTNLCY